MGVHGENLRSLKRAGYPNASDDMDDYDVAEGVSWMADKIKEMKAVEIETCRACGMSERMCFCGHEKKNSIKTEPKDE
jgi:hypothetical protein